MKETPTIAVQTVGMTTKVVRGSLWTFGGQGVVLIASLIATPFTIRLLGPEAYGLLALVNVLLGYLAFADLGMGLASTQLGSEAHALGDNLREATITWTALFAGLISSTAVAVALLISSKFLVEQVLRLPAHLHDIATVGLRLLALAFVARSASGVLNTPQLVRLRMDLNTVINSGANTLQIILVPIVFFLQGGLTGVIAAIAAIAVVAALINFAVSIRLQPLLLTTRIDLSLIRPLVRLGSTVIAGYLSGLLVANSEKLILPRLTSVTTLAHYSVAFTLASLLLPVPIALGGSLIPAFSRLKVSTDEAPLRQLYATALRGSLFWVVPAAFVICVAARPFITVWAGSEYGRESTLPSYILVVGMVFSVMAYVPSSYLLALRKAHLIAACSLVELVPYVLCAVVLIRRFGAAGAAVAWSIRVIIDAVLLFGLAKRMPRLTFSPLPKNRLSYASAVIAVLAGFTAISLNKLSGVTTVIVAVMSLIMYGGLLWMRVLTREERAWLSQALRSPLNFIFGSSH